MPPLHRALLQLQRERGNSFVARSIGAIDRCPCTNEAERKNEATPGDRSLDVQRRPQGGGAASVQRYSLDDFGNDLSGLGAAAVSGVKQAGEVLASGAQAVGQGLGAAADAAGSALVSGEKALVEGAGSAAKAVASLPAAAGGVIDWIKSEAGKLALRAAQALASRFGGKVSVSPSGGIDITIADMELAEIDDETFILPLALPTQTLFDVPFKVGDFVINTSVGSVIGDPAVTAAVGPVRLRNVSLHLDPGGGNYAGSGSVDIGSEVVGTAEKATEARVQAAGILPFEVPIPIEASGAIGIRDILRIAGKQNVQQTVSIGYSGGRFVVHVADKVKLGARAHIDHEAFVRIEIEGHEVCSVIWPVASRPLFDIGTEISAPLTIGDDGNGLSAKFGKVTAHRISAASIPTSLKNDRPPSHCISLRELGPLLCRLGKLPPSVCAVVSPGSPGPAPGVGPSANPQRPGQPQQHQPVAPQAVADCDALNRGSPAKLVEGDAEHGRAHIEARHGFKVGDSKSWHLENGVTMPALTGLLSDAQAIVKGGWKSSPDRVDPSRTNCVATANFGSRQVGWEVRNRNVDPPNLKPLHSLFLVVRQPDLEVVTMFPIKG